MAMVLAVNWFESRYSMSTSTMDPGVTVMRNMVPLDPDCQKDANDFGGGRNVLTPGVEHPSGRV